MSCHTSIRFASAPRNVVRQKPEKLQHTSHKHAPALVYVSCRGSLVWRIRKPPDPLECSNLRRVEPSLIYSLYSGTAHNRPYFCHSTHTHTGMAHLAPFFSISHARKSYHSQEKSTPHSPNGCLSNAIGSAANAILLRHQTTGPHLAAKKNALYHPGLERSTLAFSERYWILALFSHKSAHCHLSDSLTARFLSARDINSLY